MGTSDIQLAVAIARRLESLLESRFGASGRGLHEKLASVEARLPPAALPDGRYVATTRNKVVHEDAFALPDRDRFLRSARAFEKVLGGSPQASLKPSWKLVAFLIFLLGIVLSWKVPMPVMLRFGGWGAPIAALSMVFVPPVLLLWPILRNRQLRALLLVAAVVFMVGWMVAAPIVFKDVIDKARQNHAVPASTGRI
jgi:hypothetical protein